MNLPNKLTVTRLVLVLVFAVFAFPYPDYLDFMNQGNFFADTREYFALAIYVIASLTDAADGHIARKYNLITDFGKFLDPIADKLLVTAALLSLTGVSLMYLWAALIILAREFMVSGIRMLAASKGVVIAAGTLGKAKMAVQTIAIIVLLVAGVIPDALLGARSYIYFGGNVIMLLAVILTIVSGIEYVYKNRNVLFANSK
ncbi:MAG: CDP-diacylglycerol--glycerol-3-phosphate 3-phosphatidyltransferase [Clostridia bacterium]